MKKIKGKFSIVIIILGIIIWFLVELFRPQPVNWNQNYESTSSIPFGCSAIYGFLEDIFPNQKIKDNNQSLFETFNSDEFINESNANLILITDMLSIDKFVADRLVRFAERGNNVFISAHDMNEKIKDTLNIDIHWSWSIHPKEFGDTVLLKFPNNNINSQPLSFYYSRGIHDFYLSSYDTANTKVLGIKGKNNEVNFIQTKVGNGNFFIHTNPLAFTNLNIVEAGMHDYALIVLSHLPIRKTYWDEFYKPRRKYTASPIGYILSQPALKTAYIVLVATIFTFIIFELKRKQKVVPTVTPKTNSTLDFVEAVSRLYYFKRNHKDIATKQYTYFLEYIRSKYYMSTSQINDEFINRLSYKSGIEKNELRDTFESINQIINKPNVNEPELHMVNNIIEVFYKKTKN